MAGIFGLSQVARTAHARVRTAQELDARWKALPPEQQEAARAEWTELKTALGAVRYRLEAGPRGFMREFSAAYKGEEAEAVEEPKGLGALSTDLLKACTRLRQRLDQG